MGHYDDQYAEDDRKAAERTAAKRRKLRAYIIEDVKTQGIEEVLTDILMDFAGYKRRAGV